MGNWCGGARKEGKESFTYVHRDCRITVIQGEFSEVSTVAYLNAAVDPFRTSLHNEAHKRVEKTEAEKTKEAEDAKVAAVKAKEAYDKLSEAEKVVADQKAKDDAAKVEAAKAEEAKEHELVAHTVSLEELKEKAFLETKYLLNLKVDDKLNADSFHLALLEGLQFANAKGYPQLCFTENLLLGTTLKHDEVATQLFTALRKFADEAGKDLKVLDLKVVVQLPDLALSTQLIAIDKEEQDRKKAEEAAKKGAADVEAEKKKKEEADKKAKEEADKKVEADKKEAEKKVSEPVNQQQPQ